MNRKHRKRYGATLIDVAVGSMLLSMLLVPTLHLTVEAQRHNFNLQIREVMLHQANRVLEKSKNDLSAKDVFDKAYGATFGTTTKDVMVWNQNQKIVSTVAISPDRSQGGGVRLLSMVVTVWNDTNDNGRMESNEPSEELRTQWASP